MWTAKPTTLLLALALTTGLPAGRVAAVTPFADMLPVVSQVKSLVQFLFDDAKGAENTVQNFLEDGLGASQLRSLYHLVTGEPDKAVAVQRRFGESMAPVLDTVPLLGHARGVWQLFGGDAERGLSTIKRATVAAGSVLGAVVAGPAGPLVVACGSAVGNLITDAATSAAVYAANGRGEPGKFIDSYVKRKQGKEQTPGEIFDAVFSLFTGGIGDPVQTPDKEEFRYDKKLE